MFIEWQLYVRILQDAFTFNLHLFVFKLCEVLSLLFCMWGNEGSSEETQNHKINLDPDPGFDPRTFDSKSSDSPGFELDKNSWDSNLGRKADFRR